MKNLKMFEEFNEKKNHVKVTKTKFEIDGGPDQYEGWTAGDDWNGWACPYFEKPVADKIAKDMGGKLEGDKYVFDVEGMDEPDEFESQMLDTPEGKKKVWPIGAYAWVWDDLAG